MGVGHSLWHPGLMLRRVKACRKSHLAPLFDLRVVVGLMELDLIPLSADGLHLRLRTFGPASLWAAGVLVGLMMPECSCACTSKLEWLLTHASLRLPVPNTMHWHCLVAEYTGIAILPQLLYCKLHLWGRSQIMRCCQQTRLAMTQWHLKKQCADN